jgi:hypothetical protein
MRARTHTQVFPMGPLLAGTVSCVLFPEFDIYSLAATSVFSIPGWRHFTAWIGSVPATTANFKVGSSGSAKPTRL